MVQDMLDADLVINDTADPLCGDEFGLEGVDIEQLMSWHANAREILLQAASMFVNFLFSCWQILIISPFFFNRRNTAFCKGYRESFLSELLRSISSNADVATNQRCSTTEQGLKI